MYSDLFDQLGAAGGRRGGGNNGNSGNGGNNSNNNNGDDGTASVLSFKAGKMILKPREEPPPSSGENRTFRCEADTSRGEIRLVWKDDKLEWQWYDRREKRVVDTDPVAVPPSGDSNNNGGGTFERIALTDKNHRDDRIYVWTRPDQPADSDRYRMYWMQDASDERDDEIVAEVNKYLSDPSSAAPPSSAAATTTAASAASSGGSSAMDVDGGGGGTGTDAGRTGAAAGASATNQSQVDALSTILENLGMPQSSSSSDAEGGGGGTSSSSSPSGAAGAAAGAGHTLTLADLQGAMATVQQQQQQRSSSSSAAGPPLSEIVTPSAVSALMEDGRVRDRLMGLLPEDQRSPEHLRDNLNSPQVQSTFRSLTMALLPDDAGNLDGLYSVMANFQLNPADGQDALTNQNNPIQAFLDSVLKKVQREQEQEEGSGGGGEESKQEGKDEDDGNNDGKNKDGEGGGNDDGDAGGEGGAAAAAE